MKHIKGFTLIELIVIITILGIVVIVALPRFVGLHDDAKKSQEDGLVGGVREGLNIYYAESLVIGRDPLYPPILDSAATGPASASNPFFGSILESPVTEGGWEKTASHSYKGPSGTIYIYNQGTGVFD